MSIINRSAVLEVKRRKFKFRFDTQRGVQTLRGVQTPENLVGQRRQNKFFHFSDN